MPQLAVLVPVLARPHRVKPLLESLEATTEDYRVLFVCDPDDPEEIEAVREAGEWPLLRGGGYAKKINEAVRATTEPLVMLAADDLQFHPNWLENAAERLTDGVHVVGLNDLIDRPHRPDHATHFLLTREFAMEPNASGDRGPLCESYRGWFCDDELIATATRRGVYAYASDSHVEHLHVMNGKAPDDATYQLGRSSRIEDRNLFRQRVRQYL